MKKLCMTFLEEQLLPFAWFSGNEKNWHRYQQDILPLVVSKNSPLRTLSLKKKKKDEFKTIWKDDLKYSIEIQSELHYGEHV